MIKKCSITKEPLESRYTTRTEDGHTINYDLYRLGCFHHKKGLVTKKEVEQAMEEQEEEDKALRKIILNIRKEKELTASNKQRKELIQTLLDWLDRYSVTQYNKEYHCLDIHHRIHCLELYYVEQCTTQDIALYQGGSEQSDMKSIYYSEARKGIDRKVIKGLYLHN